MMKMEVIMDFKLDKAHQLQRELFRNFAEAEIRPLAKEMDEKEWVCVLSCIGAWTRKDNT